MKVLVTGGAGYIGSHVASLLKQNFDVFVLDDLSKGHYRALKVLGLESNFIKGNSGDIELVRQIIRDKKIDAVMHFAASIEVAESVENPLKYYRRNFENTLNLLEAMLKEGVKKFVFSSTAAVYGEPKEIPIPEEHPQLPTNPYGETKLAVERMLKWFSACYGLRYVSLRYFNAAGAHPELELGEDHDPETHLIPIVLQAALGLRPEVKIFGTDYPTKDGTPVRDYIHVMDLAEAHVLALEHLLKNGESRIYNLGNGLGFTVKEVIETARKVTGRNIKAIPWERRPGDPAVLVASSDKIKAELGWRPKYPDLTKIIQDAWRWHSNHPNGFADVK